MKGCRGVGGNNDATRNVDYRGVFCPYIVMVVVLDAILQQPPMGSRSVTICASGSRR